ncbi:hypothetical protein P3T37_004058 [Kitasatospora sp. MAA4]|uniref:hypothetical protein n=1 Tax=Kitasatospora sp. MAA4 TaxID=3035093 RepID=UPI002474AA61|nr:hypothetical protein [Kitasatospora sp. MAA4]MDH6134654.1 hypothetical protein [Kitasatospora sp. MAA4]
MSLASELHSLLARFRSRTAEQVNSGQLLTVDRHLDRLAAVAEADAQSADAAGHAVLAELYTALHAATSGAAPTATPTAPAPTAPAAAPAAAAEPVAPAAKSAAGTAA